MANVFRADQVGSLVKPAALLAAQAAHAQGSLDDAGLAAAQDAAIRDALQMQAKTGVTVVTDGELRRSQGDAPYVAAVAGIGERAASGVERWQSPYAVLSRLRRDRSVVQQEAAFLEAQPRKLPYKVLLHAPSALALRMFEPGRTDPHYPTLSALASGFAEILLPEIDSLVTGGVRYIQLEASAYGWLYDETSRTRVDSVLRGLTGSFDELLHIDVEMLRRVVTAPATALGLRISRPASLDPATDTYERLLEKVLPTVPVDRFLLEYPQSQAHDFQALRSLPAGKIAVLGLVNTDAPAQEVDDLLGRFDQAAACTEEERLAISPRRGFANGSGKPVESLLELQRLALERTAEVVQRVWGLEL